LRYEGELEIALKNLGTDEKRSIVSKIVEKDIELLDYISIVKKFEFIHNDDSN
jgi:outer surface protein